MKLDGRSLLRYSRQLVDRPSLGGWALRMRYVRSGLRHRRAVGRLLQPERASAFRAQAERNPALTGFFLWPFLNADWDVERRFDGLIRHYDVVARRFPWLRLGFKEALTVLDAGELCPGLRFVIEDAPWFVREGCVNFSMLYGEERLMSVSFALSDRGDEIDALVGSIQGSSRESVVETYKIIAKAMQDLRPRDLHFKVFRLLMQSLGVSRVLCVADAHRAQTAAFFAGTKAEKIKLRYDELWLDQGGVLDADGFYVMPAAMEERPLSDVPGKKRSRYKRRLEMFAQLQQRLQDGVARLAQRPGP